MCSFTGVHGLLTKSLPLFHASQHYSVDLDFAGAIYMFCRISQFEVIYNVFFFSLSHVEQTKGMWLCNMCGLPPAGCNGCCLVANLQVQYARDCNSYLFLASFGWLTLRSFFEWDDCNMHGFFSSCALALTCPLQLIRAAKYRSVRPCECEVLRCWAVPVAIGIYVSFSHRE